MDSSLRVLAPLFAYTNLISGLMTGNWKLFEPVENLNSNEWCCDAQFCSITYRNAYFINLFLRASEPRFFLSYFITSVTIYPCFSSLLYVGFFDDYFCPISKGC